MLKRSNEPDTKATLVEWPGLVIDIIRYEVKIEEQVIEPTPREIELLYFLSTHPNRVFTREFLLKEIWDYHYMGGTRTVDVHINRLREKIERPHLPWHIKTIWGVGYKFETGES